MELTPAQMNRWAGKRNTGSYNVQLKQGESMPLSSAGGTLRGPAIVSVTVYRDGGWSAFARGAWTTEEIAR